METWREKNGNSKRERESELGLQGESCRDWEVRKTEGNTL